MTTKFNKVVSFEEFAKKEYRKRKSRSVELESTIEKDVKSYAKKKGVLARKYTSPANPSVPDDIFFFDNGVTVLMEFKRPGKKLSGNQAREIYKLLIRGHLVYVINSRVCGYTLIDYYTDLAAKGGRAKKLHIPTEKQWQEISTSKGRVTADKR